MSSENKQVNSGVDSLDRLLGGLFIGDNVVWYDSAGSLASVFWMNFIRASQARGKPMIYVCFDRSPKNLLEKLGPLANAPDLTILDCFTHGKGESSDIFLQFYDPPDTEFPCRIVPVKDPENVENMAEILFGIHRQFTDEVCFVFESLTGMQDLWENEETVLKYYSRTCPRLYELNTVAYWMMEKEAHSPRLRAHINAIAQVAIELSVKRGKTFLTLLKAENRQIETRDEPLLYWTRDFEVTFQPEGRAVSRFDLGARVKTLRKQRGLSQTELARLIGVTPSNISQVESNIIFPSIPALIKMAEILSVDISAFFQEPGSGARRAIFPGTQGIEVHLSDLPKGSIIAKRLLPLDMDDNAEPYLIEIPPGKKLPSHFFLFKGEEIGYLISGAIQLKLNQTLQEMNPGDTIYLTDDTPSQWINPGEEPARFFWVKLRRPEKERNGRSVLAIP
ncbi:MAG: helix-turn-helix domain-containing protein [Thermodesulfobacteriota bacterium]